MLEIFLIWQLAKNLARKCEERGQNKAWAALGPLGWILGEIAGFFLSGVLGLETVFGYVMALALAITGAVVAWVVVSNLPPGNPDTF